MRILQLFLTDLKLHARNFREAKTFEKTVRKDENGNEKGRIYCNHSLQITPDGKFIFCLKLPEDIQRQIKDGEIKVQIFVPKGLGIYLGRDAVEKMQQLRKKERLKLAHTCQTMHKE